MSEQNKEQSAVKVGENFAKAISIPAEKKATNILSFKEAIPFALVVAWALWGIKANQGLIYPLIQSITTLSIACLFVMIAITLIKRDPKII
jgi:hypothetical protein